MYAATDQQLLQAYAASKSESAFAELVRRHIDLVYSAALRRIGDPHLAQDVTQGTFAALAQNARSLTSHPVLSGWLHRTTQNIATNLIRTSTRRHAREQEAVIMSQLLSTPPGDAGWDDIGPHLDAALDELDSSDRDAVMLRYFEKKSAHEMATQLGISDDAAQKRVCRAVQRLREFFAKRGVTVGASGLAIVLSANAVQAAPVGLALTISTAAALTGTALATTATVTATKTIAMTALQKTAIAATITVLAGVGIYEARQASQLSKQVQTLQLQQSRFAFESAQLHEALSAATNRLATLQGEFERLDQNNNELLRLRGEVGQLRKGNGNAANLNAENLDLKRKLAQIDGWWRFTTNAPQFKNPFLARNEWTDQGTTEPINCLQTMLWALKQGDDQKLNQLVSRPDESQSLDSLLLPKQFWDKVTGVQVVDISIISGGGPQRKAIIGTILQKQRPSPGTAFDNPALEIYRNSEQSMRRWFFVETNGQWLITGGG